MLAAEPATPPSTGVLVIAVASVAVAVVAGRALTRVLAALREITRLAIETSRLAIRLALRLAALLTGVLVVLSFSLLQMLPL